MKNSAILGFFIYLLLLGSCKDDTIDNRVVIDVPDEFNVLLWENLSQNERTFQINLETIETNSCEDATIEYTQVNQSVGVFLTVHDIINDHCTQGSFPAKADIAVGSLSSTEYPLDINLKNVVPNTGKLNVTDEYYEIIIDDLNGIIIPNQKLYKVPENSIWGYVAYEDATGEIPHDNFMAELGNHTSSFSPTPGYYGYFTVEQNASIQLANDLAQQYINPFIFQFNGQSSQLEDLRATYNDTNYPGVEFKIYTSKGEEF